MAKYTKAQVDEKIALILDNNSKLVNAAIVRAVLATLRDMEQLASYIKHVNLTLDTLTVEDALTAITNANIPVFNVNRPYKAGFTVYWQYILYVANIDIVTGGQTPDISANWIPVAGGSGGTMTAGQIKAALETLQGTARLSASAINGLLTDADQLTYDDPAFGFIGSALNYLVLRQNMDYSQTLAYKVGNIVFYNSKLYRCKLACVNVPPTSTNNWELAVPAPTSEADFVAFYNDLEKKTDFVVTTGGTVSFDERCLLSVKGISYIWEIQNEAENSPIVYKIRKSFDYDFDTAGTYTIRLSVFNSEGGLIDSIEKQSFIEVADTIPDFTVYYGTSEDTSVSQGEVEAGTTYIDTTPIETQIDYNITTPAVPWFAAPASNEYTHFQGQIAGWMPISDGWTKSQLYINSILYTLYVYTYPTQVNYFMFKKITS